MTGALGTSMACRELSGGACGEPAGGRELSICGFVLGAAWQPAAKMAATATIFKERVSSMLRLQRPTEPVASIKTRIQVKGRSTHGAACFAGFINVVDRIAVTASKLDAEFVAGSGLSSPWQDSFDLAYFFVGHCRSKRQWPSILPLQELQNHSR